MYHTGIEALDQALFDGGIPPGSLVEIYGATDCGKTALALWTCRTAQRETDALVGWVCAETNLGADNLRWAGVDLDGLVIARQTEAMPGLTAAKIMVEEGVNVVVVDSIAALLGDEPGLYLAATLGRGLPALREAAQQHGAVVLLTNQERSVGLGHVTSHAGAGRLLYRMLDAQIHLRSGAGLFRGGVQRGMRIHFTLVKNGEETERWGRVGKFNCYWQAGLKDLGEKSL